MVTYNYYSLMKNHKIIRFNCLKTCVLPPINLVLMTPEQLLKYKKLGFSDKRIQELSGIDAGALRAKIQHPPRL